VPFDFAGSDLIIRVADAAGKDCLASSTAAAMTRREEAPARDTTERIEVVTAESPLPPRWGG